jgi:phage/plasmid-like protein (TIGR03299 family)
MAHLVENMMYVGKPPWHGLGKELPMELTAIEALPHAGLDWSVKLQPVYTANGVILPDALFPSSSFSPVDGYSAVVRELDGFALGIVGKKYLPIQNRDVAALADAIAGEGQGLCHTAGSLDHGRRIWFLLKLPGELKVGNDKSPIEKHLLLTTTHDGSGTYRVLFTPIRVVCANTLNIALQVNDGLSIRHTSGAQAQVEAAKVAMKGVIDFYQRFESLSQAFASTPYTDKQMKELAEELYPIPKQTQNETEDKKEAGEKIKVHAIHPIILKNREKLTELFTDGVGHEAIRGTAWAALNAVVEYVDHWRTSRASDGNTQDENRVKSLWFGSGADFKSQALFKIKEQTGLALAA